MPTASPNYSADTQRYFVQLAYCGTAYCGWQRQPNGVGVQQVLEEALATILRTPTPIVGAGRTDAGVHARLMVAHFDAAPQTDLPHLCRRLNSLLPPDVSVYSIRPVHADAHARFDAVSRRYEYWVSPQKTPFLPHMATVMTYPLNFEKMNEAAAILLQYTDFTSFSKLHTDVKTNNCDVRLAHWAERDGMWVFSIEADRFLRNMVRAIVGTLFEVGRGKLDVEGFRRIVEAKDRNCAGTSAPPDGLYLVDVRYNF